MRSRGLEVAKDEPLAVVDVVEEGREYQRLNSHELDEDVDGGTTGVFQGVTDGVPNDCGLEVGYVIVGKGEIRIGDGGEECHSLTTAGN